MKRRFVICVDDSTGTQQDTLTKYFKDSGKVGYWHWFSDMWLLTDPNRHWTANSLRDKVKELLPGTHIMIVQIDGDNTWSGFGSTKMFDWMNDTWSE